ncbi:MAG: glycosyltransferase family 4 protein, partial [bacterium]
MKRILVVSTKIPFSKGGDSFLIDSLVKELSKNFEVEKIYIPFSTDPNLIEQQTEAIRNMKFDYGDLAIVSRPFSYAIKHKNKVAWFMHHLREFYDLWDTNLNPLKNKKEKYQKIRKKIIEYDNQFLKECKKIFAISENVKARLKKYNKIHSEVLYPPLDNKEKYSQKEPLYQNFFFFPSRIAFNKRQHLVIESLKYTKQNFKLILAGQKEESYFEKKIAPLLEDPVIKNKLEILDYIDEDKKIDLYSKCLGIVFTPFDEDYGYVTVEAFYSSKSVITTIDSGGPLEFVEHNKTGIICEPDPIKIAQAMDDLYINKEKAIQMGKKAK